MNKLNSTNNVELLSPVGDLECLKAAVQNGADTVYFGMDQFNARMYANNINNSNIKEAIMYCKLRNVKTNLTLNILIKNNEFNEAINVAKEAYEAGIDAIIVQDLGLAKYLIETFPDMPIHASTQMTAHNLEGVLELEKLGFKRVVLSRELSINEIEYICKNSAVEIETFIHGALCISYSGQCLFSSIVGGRSGNRGRCAGPCRMPYELLQENNEDGLLKTIDKGYLLSSKDLCGLSYIPRLVQAGVKCLKIEGRMKNPEYVATVTRIYRKYIDMALNEQEYIIDNKDIEDLMQVFNRGGFSNGHLDTESNKDFIFKDKPNHMGIYLGRVEKYNKSKGLITLKLKSDISIGDSISLEKEKDSKYLVSELMDRKNNIKISNSEKIVTIGRMKGNINLGDKVYKVSSKELTDKAHNSYINCENIKTKLNCKITIKKDLPISLNLFTNNNNNNELYNGINITVTSNVYPEEAINSPINIERVIKQISKTNNTPYVFDKISVILDDNLHIPSISTLNELRRTALEKLEKEIENRVYRKSPEISITKNENCLIKNETNNVTTYDNPKISLLLRNINKNFDYSKLDNSKINRIYLPFKLFLNKFYKLQIEELSKKNDLYIYLPNIIRSNFKNIILHSLNKILDEFNIKGFVISNIADFKLLEKYKDSHSFIGNYTLNCFNNSTFEEYMNLGLDCTTISRELNKNEINEILRTSNNNKELIVYGNLPIMSTNYCFLGKANHCYPECGVKCKENNKYYLKDRLGFKFRVLPDNLQTVTSILNSKTLSISTKDILVNFVRVDILDESIDEINNILNTVYLREKLEGKDYTNGNLNKDI